MWVLDINWIRVRICLWLFMFWDLPLSLCLLWKFKIYILYLSLTSCALTTRHPRLALNRRSLSMPSTVRGGSSSWLCAGLTHTHTYFKRTLLQSHSLRCPLKQTIMKELILVTCMFWVWLFSLSAGAVRQFIKWFSDVQSFERLGYRPGKSCQITVRFLPFPHLSFTTKFYVSNMFVLLFVVQKKPKLKR